LQPRNRCHPPLGFVIQLFVTRASLLLAGIAPGSLADIDEMANKPGYMCSRVSDSNSRNLSTLTGHVASLLRGNPLAPLPALAPQDLQITSGLSSHQAILVLKQGCSHSPKLVRNICRQCTMKHRLLAIPAVRTHLYRVEMESLSRVVWTDLPLPPRVPAVMLDGWGFLSQTSIMDLAMTRTHPLPSRHAVDSPHAVDSLDQVGLAPAEIVEACLQATARISNMIILELIALIPAALSHRGATEESLGPTLPYGLLSITNRATITAGPPTRGQPSRLGHEEKAALLACAIELLTRARLAAADICRFRAISATIRRAIKPPLLPEEGTVFVSTIPPLGSVSSRHRIETSNTLSNWGGFRPAEVSHILVVSSDVERATLASQTHTRRPAPGAHPPVPFGSPDDGPD
jgi:hypothetical protein